MLGVCVCVRTCYFKKIDAFRFSYFVMQRIHILEALEAFSDMGVAGNFLQGQPDFNE